MLDIKDKPGAITRDAMRMHFEKMVNNTPILRKNTSLKTITVNEKFSHYAAQETHTFWSGFALGMRYAERITGKQL